jgi:signal transduction histidine kinase
MSVIVPLEARELRTGYLAFRALSELYHSIKQVRDEAIEIDCQQLSWIDAHLAAPLMTIVHQSATRGNSHSLRNLKDNIKLILSKNRTFANRQAVDTNHTTMPVTHFDLHEEVAFANYTRTHVARKEMPKMSSALQAKFFEGIDELFANSSLHSKAAVKVSVSGQFFPRTNRLSFVISDGGIGIDGSLRNAGITSDSAVKAIDWAMQSNNTSRQGDIPGGLGLRLIRDFVEANNGTLTVASSEGVWSQVGRDVSMKTMRRPFPGTAVVLEINTSDQKRYDLKRAPDPRNIW